MNRFHKAQEGEEGYEAELDEREKSSLEQLVSNTTLLIHTLEYQTTISSLQSSSSHTSFKEYAEESPFLPLPGTPLTKPHADFLAKFLNPAYLSPQGLTALSKKFAQESSIELRSFLIDSVAIKLEPLLKAKDQKDGTGEKRVKPIPRHTAGVDDTEWTLVGPPHKARYLSLSDTSSLATDPTIESCQTAADILHILRTQLFPSEPFRAWLSLVSSLVPMSHSVEVRRFRPGLDYTLATSEVSEVRLDAVLDLTPSVGGEGEDEGWDSGRWGGWQVGTNSLCCYVRHSLFNNTVLHGTARR